LVGIWDSPPTLGFSQSRRVTTMDAEFKLISSETLPLTPELADKFRAMDASPTERGFDKARANMLRTKAEEGRLIAFNWAVAKLGDKTYRMNGQHSSAVLSELNGQFPQGLKVHLDTYQVDNRENLASLFRQFDARKSGRTPTDVAGAYQGLHEELAGVAKPSAKLAAEGAAWYDKYVMGLPAPTGDDVYMLFAREKLYPFFQWVGEIFSIKTPELRRVPVVGAMYGAFDKNEAEARKFWMEVSRGGVEFEDSHPATVLDSFLKSVVEEKRKFDLKPANFYQASAYAWNAFREGKTITSIKFDTRKGLYQIAE
jgi:hypothetical protein